ncbi:MAG: helix-turn-helix domain-containing protein [Deltaproteobacteria bacterium]|nr:helix-turn-helix domain-containing protein [Deltaproteobacteria bacterium]
MSLGSLMRRYRKERKLTLRAVAERAGVSEGFLSQVENNVSSPSVDTLIGICNALGISAGDLLNQVDKQERLVVIRRSDWQEVDLPHSGFVTRRFLSPENRAVIDSAILVVRPGTSIPVRKNIRNGQEILCILTGSLGLVQGESTVQLSEGDSVHFWSYPEKQSITNNGRELAVALWVGTL